jgi:hypothetical protein
MKKSLIVPAILMLVTSAAAESRLFLSVGASFLRPADEGYRAVYGNQAVYPEISAAARLIAGLCLTASTGQFSRHGTTPELGLETSATQSYYSVGLSYLLRVSSNLCLEAGAGMANLRFREEALGTQVEGRHSGFKAEGGVLLIPEDERIFLGLKVGYLSAEVPGEELEPVGTQPVRLGGLRIAVSIGIQLFHSD